MLIARAKAAGLPLTCEVHFANRVNQLVDLVTFIASLT